MIVPSGKGKYVVTSEDGSKRLSKPLPKHAAERRLKQVEYFKARNAKRRINRTA